MAWQRVLPRLPVREYLIFCCVALVITFAVGWKDPENATRVLKDQGYTEIEITGLNFMSCNRGDYFRTGFAAKNPTGKTITGTVCAGLISADATIRVQ